MSSTNFCRRATILRGFCLASCFIAYFTLLVIFLTRLEILDSDQWSHRGVNFLVYALALLSHAIGVALLFTHRAITLSFFVGAGLILRGLALLQEPYTGDIWRFLSDGLNLINGKNPYTASPLLQEVEYWNMKSMYAITLWPYFALGALLAKLWTQKWLAFKILAGLLELSLLLYFTFRLHNKKLLAVLWSSPLLIFENWHEGHVEMVALLPLLLAFESFKRKGVNATALWLAALSAALKLQGFLLLLWFRLYPRPFGNLAKKLTLASLWRFDWLWLVFFIALNLALLPTLFFQATKQAAESGLVMYWVSWQHSQPFIALGKFLGLSQNSTICCLQLLFLGGMIFFFIRRWSGTIGAASLLVGWLACLVFLFPVQHPWYYQILLVYILNFRKYRLLALLLQTLIGINYLSYTPAFEASVAPQLLVWFCVLVLSFWAKNLFFFFSVKKISSNRQKKGVW